MLLYFIMLAAALAFGIPLCSEKCGKWGKIVYCAVCAVAFIFISATRFQVGYDYNSYASMYFNMKYFDVEDIMNMREEKGFIFPLYVLDLAFENYWVVFIYTSIIIYGIIFLLIYKNSSKPWISVTAFLGFGLYFNSLCFLRQFIAALIVACAIKYVTEKNPLRFMVLTIVAASFHWSALLMILMYLLLRIKPGYIYLGIVVLGTVIFCIFSKSLLGYIVDMSYVYKGYNPETSVEMQVGLPPRYTIMFGILFLICFVFRKKLIEKKPANAVYINCFMYATVFEAIGMQHAILSRFTILFYIPPVLYLLPDAVEIVKNYINEKIKKTGVKNVVKVGTVTSAAAFVTACYTILIVNNYNGVTPYVSQFNRPYDILVEQIENNNNTDNDDDDNISDDEIEKIIEDSDNEDENEELNNAILDQLS